MENNIFFESDGKEYPGGLSDFTLGVGSYPLPEKEPGGEWDLIISLTFIRIFYLKGKKKIYNSFSGNL